MDHVDLKTLVCFENPHFVVFDKPSGWLSVPSRDRNEKRPVLRKEAELLLGLKLLPCHRLDFEVSGLIVFAKDPGAHRACNHWFENQMIKKTYQALTEGDPLQATPYKNPKILESRIIRGKKRAYERPYGKLAQTELLFEAESTDSEWGAHLAWRLKPLTGRPHQLRFEIAKAGFPILGDELYGSSRPFSSGIALRAYELKFNPESEYKDFGLPETISTTRLVDLK